MNHTFARKGRGQNSKRITKTKRIDWLVVKWPPAFKNQLIMILSEEIRTLDEFLKGMNVKYVLTGTAALYYHGLLPIGAEVHDIDIKVLTSQYTPEERQEIQKKFKELEKLSGCQYNSEHYQQQVYIFKVGSLNTYVNVFENNSEYHFQRMNIFGTEILVHDAFEILKEKFSMKRPKDYEFYMKLNEQLLSYFVNK